MKNLPTLYSRASTGALRQWTMHVNGSEYWAVYGQIDGKMITDPATVAEPKNVGRSNETSAEEQAFLEAKARWQKQFDSGYVTDIALVDQDKGFYLPMLADDFFKQKKVQWPGIAQPKLDGIRNIAYDKGNQSREGNFFVSCPHVTNELKEFFDELPGAMLDGEFYNHDLHDDFNEIVSLVKREKVKPADIAKAAELVQYWVYDCIKAPNITEKDTYETRMNVLHNSPAFQRALARGVIKIIPQQIVHSLEELDACFEKWVDEGYEGAMLRYNDAVYESDRRSKKLLKYKNFIEGEFIIQDIEEGKKGKTIGIAAKMHFVTAEGKPFKANVKGKRSLRKEYLDKAKEYIGSKATVIYFKPTPDGIPRFPRVKAIRNYE